MQRCPYIHEMRERLLGQPQESLAMESMERDGLINDRDSTDSNQVGTVVKLHADGYHTSPTHQRTPLVPRDLGEDFNLDFDDDAPIDARRPKNANHDLDFYVQRPKRIIQTDIPQEKPRFSLRTSLFIITSLVYAMILIVVCIAYVISDVTTHRLPVVYYEGFFTYLYGISILFLLYVFCFLLQESACCNGNSKPKPPPKEKKQKKQKPKKGDAKDAGDSGKEGGKGGTKDSSKGGKPSPFQEKFPKKKRDMVRERLLSQDSSADVEAVPATPKSTRKRKTTVSDQSHGSFFLRVGAIAFGLGSMIYIGLEFGSFFEIPFTSKCHHILIGVNPLLQMIFTFMQMYFIFMNSRLNIHRFKVLARFGLMHVVATNICVWIRTLVKESLYEITIHFQRGGSSNETSIITNQIRRHALLYAGKVLKTDLGPKHEVEVIDSGPLEDFGKNDDNLFSRMVKTSADGISNVLGNRDIDEYHSTTRRPFFTLPTTTSTTTEFPTTTSTFATTILSKIKKFITSTTTTTPFPLTSPTTTTTTTTTTTQAPTSIFQSTTAEDLITTTTTTTSTPSNTFASIFSLFSTPSTTSTTENSFILNNLFGGLENNYQTASRESHDLVQPHITDQYERMNKIYAAALSSNIATLNSSGCERVDIMGTIVYDSAPYLYPFIIEYSLVGAVVLYVMWKHIGRNPKYMNEEDLEHRLEVMLSRRAVAMAQQARTGRVDCVGSSKGLFFGLLLLVGSLICLILFFVLVRHQNFYLLAIYLADVSHCGIMALAMLAILIGFCRVKSLKFRCEEQSNLNDILLRISAFGLFVYSVFSVISGSLKALDDVPSLLVMITGILAVFQVVFQLLFIADVSRRRVHLPEHDRSKPGRQIVTFLLICNVSIFAIYTFEAQKVAADPVQLNFYGFVPWSIIQRVTLPLCIFHRFHSAVTLAEIWKTTYKPRLE